MEKSSAQTKIPEWAGRYPFPPDEKRPTLLTEWRMPRLYGIPPFQVSTCLYVSTDRITSSGFKVRPGQWFEPADIHGGTEVYFVRSGEATAIDPETGRTCVAPAGSAVYIPVEVWHQTHNFGEEELDIITFFAPKMWVDEIGVEVFFNTEPKMFTGSKQADTYPLPASPNFVLAGPDDGVVGSYPCRAGYALKARRIFTVSPQQTLRLVHGHGSRALISLFVCNEVISVGTILIPPGSVTELESHPGDEVLCGLTGELSVVIQAGDQSARSVSVPRLEVEPGERLLIPEGHPHSYYNSSDKPVFALFAVAPQL